MWGKWRQTHICDKRIECESIFWCVYIEQTLFHSLCVCESLVYGIYLTKLLLLLLLLLLFFDLFSFYRWCVSVWHIFFVFSIICFVGANVQGKSQMGIPIPDLRDADNVANAYGAHKQANQINGTFTVQCKVSIFVLCLFRPF